MVAPDKAWVESADRSQRIGAAEGESGDLLKAVYMGGTDTDTAYAVALVNLPARTVNAAMALAARIDASFTGRTADGRGPSKGSVVRAARDIISSGAYPLLTMAVPEWMQADPALVAQLKTVQAASKPLNQAALARLQGSIAAEAEKLAGQAQFWGAMGRTADSVADVAGNLAKATAFSFILATTALGIGVYYIFFRKRNRP